MVGHLQLLGDVQDDGAFGVHQGAVGQRDVREARQDEPLVVELRPPCERPRAPRAAVGGISSRSVTISASGSSVNHLCRIWTRIFTSSSLTSLSAPSSKAPPSATARMIGLVERLERVAPRQLHQVVHGVLERLRLRSAIALDRVARALALADRENSSTAFRRIGSSGCDAKTSSISSGRPRISSTWLTSASMSRFRFRSLSRTWPSAGTWPWRGSPGSPARSRGRR